MLLDFDTVYKKYDMNITGVIHIGGHHGQEYKTYKRYPSIKKMVFFEPDPDSYKILENVASGDSAVTLVNTALGPLSCRMDLHKAKNTWDSDHDGQSNSLCKPHLHKEQYPHILFNDTVEVKVHPLDKYEPNKIFNMINIDVQGFELEVFRGAKKTLNHIDYIIAEVNKEELYKDCVLVDELDSFLAVYGFSRVETKWITDTTLGNYRPKGKTWGDALYIKI